MKKYNIFYKVKNKRVNKKELTWEEVCEFLDTLGKEEESELKIIQVKEREEEER